MADFRSHHQHRRSMTRRTPPVSSAATRQCGFTMIELLAVLVVLGLLAALLLPAVQASREASRSIECRNHLHQFGVALHAFEATHKRLPSLIGVPELPPQGTEGYSPHLRMLDLLGYPALGKQAANGIGTSPSMRPYHWERTHAWAKEPIPLFLCPTDGAPWGTNYVFCTGSGIAAIHDYLKPWQVGAFSHYTGHRLSEIADGLAHTTAMSEHVIAPPDRPGFDRRVHYLLTGLKEVLPPDQLEQALRKVCPAADPQSTPYDPIVGWQWYVPSYGRTWYNHAAAPNSPEVDCSAEPPDPEDAWFGFHPPRSWHPGSVNLLALDGAVQVVSEGIDVGVWQDLATIAGGRR